MRAAASALLLPPVPPGRTCLMFGKHCAVKEIEMCEDGKRAK